MIPDPWCGADRHGDSQWAYHEGCRCTPARAANAAAQRIRTRRRRGEDIPRQEAASAEAFPFEPLGALVTASGLYDEPTAIWRLYHRAKLRGSCSAASADKLAIGLLGIHPALVWGESWWLEDVAA